jgi:hypothetical protein
MTEQKPYIVLYGTHEDLRKDTKTIRYRGWKYEHTTYEEATNNLILRPDIDHILLRTAAITSKDLENVIDSEKPYSIVSLIRSDVLYPWSPLPSWQLDQGPSIYYWISNCSKNNLRKRLKSVLQRTEKKFHDEVFVGIELKWKEATRKSRENEKAKYLDDKVKGILGEN